MFATAFNKHRVILLRSVMLILCCLGVIAASRGRRLVVLRTVWRELWFVGVALQRGRDDSWLVAHFVFIALINDIYLVRPTVWLKIQSMTTWYLIGDAPEECSVSCGSKMRIMTRLKVG